MTEIKQGGRRRLPFVTQCVSGMVSKYYSTSRKTSTQMIEKREGKEKRSSHKGNGADLRKGKVL